MLSLILFLNSEFHILIRSVVSWMKPRLFPRRFRCATIITTITNKSGYKPKKVLIPFNFESLLYRAKVDLDRKYLFYKIKVKGV